MTKTSYIITLAVDEKWFKAIDEFTVDVYEGELCSWIRVDAETETDEDLTNDNDDEIIK
jgi:hypothetical protein